MNFKTKIWMLPTCAAAVFIIGCAVSYVVGARTQATLEQLRVQDHPVLEAVGKIERGVEQFRLTVQSAAAEGDESKLKEVLAIATQTGAALDALGQIDGKAALAIAIREPWVIYQQSALGATRAMLGKGDPGDHLRRMQASMQALDKQLALHKAEAQRAVAAGRDAAAGGVQRSLYVVLATCAAALLALGTASKLIVASVWRELGDEPSRLSAAIRRVADGDLESSEGEGAQPGSVSATLAAMTVRLRETVATISNASDAIATATREIAAGNQDLSTRTEHTATNLQRVTGAVSELTGSVGQSTESARQADALAGSASQAAQQGRSIVASVVENMSEISTASRRITEIIGVIDGIAFQTNILALNAAVEAARAGEQGRGFAVVAGEVRTLSQRSAQAAKEIKALIDISSDKVDGGAKLVSEAGDAMQQIVAGVQRVSETFAGISVASSRQSEGIADVNRSVVELDQMTQQNAALVEQSAAAAESLRGQADRLAAAVAAFRIGGAAPPSVPRPATPASATKSAAANRTSDGTAARSVATAQAATAL